MASWSSGGSLLFYSSFRLGRRGHGWESMSILHYSFHRPLFSLPFKLLLPSIIVFFISDILRVTKCHRRRLPLCIVWVVSLSVVFTDEIIVISKTRIFKINLLKLLICILFGLSKPSGYSWFYYDMRPYF